MSISQRIPTFDPLKLAYYEKENYVAYYQRRWLRLIWISVAMVREAFHLNLWQGIYGAYLVARAEYAAAPFPDNDIPLAEAYMRRFYTLIQRSYKLELDIEKAARVEVNWWVVHRRHFAQEDNRELVEALTRYTIEVYGIEPDLARQVATHRAQGILHSDLWVRNGLDPKSPLLAWEQDALCQGYTLLRSAFASSVM